MKRVLVTGPVERIDEWCAAARAAGWVAIEFPLLAIVPRNVDPRSLADDLGAYDAVCVTSSSALPFLEHAARVDPRILRVPLAAVGESTSARAGALGYSLAFQAQRDVYELVLSLGLTARPKSRILWPRGDRADDLSRALRAEGHVVDDPVVYEARTRSPGPAPDCEAVFFASPSAIGVWRSIAPRSAGPRVAIAIGRTTLETLLAEEGACFERTVALGDSTPGSFEHALAHLECA